MLGDVQSAAETQCNSATSFDQAFSLPNQKPGEIISVGTDIEAVTNFPSDVMLSSAETFRSTTYSPEEVAYASTRCSPVLTLLGMFCAKEAVIKCCSSHGILGFRDIKIRHDHNGMPLCDVCGFENFDFKVSISHADNYACAFAVMVRG